LGFGTRAIHAGQKADPQSGAVIIPISLSTTFQQDGPGGLYQKFEYSRTGNPTRVAFEECVASLEHAKFGIAFASGLAATTSLIHLLKSGDHVISVDDVYGGTRRYFTRIASNFGLSFDFLDLSNPEDLKPLIKPTTKFIWVETPTNPLLKVVDIRAVAAIAHAHNIQLIVDNTFMSPYFQNPLLLGADIVLHSVTKYLNGHSDVVMGVVCTNDEEIRNRLKFNQNGMGGIPSPFDAFLALRGIKTLHVRMEQHQRNAFEICKYLTSSPHVERVIYPGLESHPQHAIAKSQCSGFGGMITFYMKGTEENSRAFLKNLTVFAVAESLGGVESLIELPCVMTHASVPIEERAKLGILDTTIRISVGIEDVKDLIADLENGFQHAYAKK